MWRRRDKVHSRRAAFARHMRELRRFRSWPHVGRLVAVQAWVPLGAGFVMPFVALFLRHEHGASMGQVGLVLGLDGAAIALASLAVPSLARRLGVVRTWIAMEALSLPFLLLIPLSSSLTLVAVFMIVRAALMNMGWPLFNQISMEGVPPRERTTVSPLSLGPSGPGQWSWGGGPGYGMGGIAG